MSDTQVYQSDEMSIATPAACAIGRRVAQDIAVEMASALELSGVRDACTDLLMRADAPNMFMDPALVQVAARLAPAAHHRALLAWKRIRGQRKLVGVWSFAVGRPRWSMLPMRMLIIPPCVNGYLATPVIDRDHLDETLDAMLDCIADAQDLPKIMALDAMGAESATYQALMRVLARRHSTPCVFGLTQRPKLQSDLDGTAYLQKALSSSTRKKLRQHRRKLSERGALTCVVAAEPAAVRAAMEDFLYMEASGWKGREGTAILSDEADAAFMRDAVGALADHGCVSIYTLYLDGKAISAQIVVRSGAAAFTWKTAYDEALRDFSPGVLLFEDYTTALLADKSITFVDSCSFDDGGYMASWSERQAVRPC